MNQSTSASNPSGNRVKRTSGGQNGGSDANTSVSVAVRVRPLLGQEHIEKQTECLKVLSKKELMILGKGTQFTFDNVFGQNSGQSSVYMRNVSPLVKSLFDGYNATVLAYGQTGSGKTYTMGTSSEYLVQGDEESMGIIPRAVEEIFEICEERMVENPGAQFFLRVQFLELYGEDIRDLLDPNKKDVNIREGSKGEGMIVDGAVEETIKCADDAYRLLERGSVCRVTGATSMNMHSSRSHAIYTIFIEQHLPISSRNVESSESDQINQAIENSEDSESSSSSEEEMKPEVEYRQAKFHFVDLAGSERAKRTGATGTRFREGIQINRGLLCLGNVISALGDESKIGSHVPYRDSKLTRMLQDSLGGNSRTCMIACVSPAENSMEETLNALRYANRARNIKNKPIVNRDPKSSQIAFLKEQIAKLLHALNTQGSQGVPEGFEQVSKQMIFEEQKIADNSDELEIALTRAQDAEDELKRLHTVVDREKRYRSEVQERLSLATAQVDYYLEKLNASSNAAGTADSEAVNEEILNNAKYVQRIHELEARLVETDADLNQTRQSLIRLRAKANSFEDCQEDIPSDAIQSSRSMQLNNQANNTEFRAFHEDSNLCDVTAVGTAISEAFAEKDLVSVQINDDDEPEIVELKQKFEANQKHLKDLVHSYDVTLKVKNDVVKQVALERKKFEAMKEHYESKMREMGAEVQETQKQCQELNEKINKLEAKKSSAENVAAISRLRSELRTKNERLKNLETQSKELTTSQRKLRELDMKEKGILREIEAIKRQKVEQQRKIEDLSRRYRDETQKKVAEIAQLRKAERSLKADKAKLVTRADRDEKLLKQKTDQVVSMQRKLREAQKITYHNRQLSEKEKKQREKLERWAKERIKKDQDLEKLQRALEKKTEAIKRKEKLVSELEELKRNAEERARNAELDVALSKERMERKVSQHCKRPDLQTIFSMGNTASVVTSPADDKQLVEEDNENIGELRDKMEAVDHEISFFDQKMQEAVASLSDDEEDDHIPSQNDTGFSSNASAATLITLPEESGPSKRKGDLIASITSVDEGKRMLSSMMQIYADEQKKNEELSAQLNAYKAGAKSGKESLGRRKSLFFGSSSGISSPGMSTPQKGISRPPVVSPDSTSLGDVSSVPPQAMNAILAQNQRMRGLLKKHNISFEDNQQYDLLIEQYQRLVDQVGSMQVTSSLTPYSTSRKLGRMKRSSLFSQPRKRESKGVSQGGSLVNRESDDVALLSPPKKSANDIKPSENSRSSEEVLGVSSVSNREPYWERLHRNAKPLAPMALKVKKKNTRFAGLPPGEVPVDQGLEEEELVDDYSPDDPGFPKKSSSSGEGIKVEKEQSDPPSFQKPTESSLRAQEGKVKRESTGKSTILKPRTQAGKEQSNSLSSANRGARARQTSWQCTMNGSVTTPPLTDNHLAGTPPSEQNLSDGDQKGEKVSSGLQEKENKSNVNTLAGQQKVSGSTKPHIASIHERLNDPAYFTGVQKVKNEEANSLAKARKQLLLQERKMRALERAQKNADTSS